MKINRKLLPLKAHFFIGCAGAAPIVPFIPIIAKQLGFTSIHIGWIQAISPILPIFLKPLVGSIADKYNCQKLVFLTFLVLSSISLYSIKWIDPLPAASGDISLSCQDGLYLQFCSKIGDKLNIDELNKLVNSSVICKPNVEKNVNYGVFWNNNSNVLGQKNNSISKTLDSLLKLGELYKTKDNCSLIKVESTMDSGLSYCSKDQSGSLLLDCKDETIRNVYKSQNIEGYGILGTKQFWLLLFGILGSSTFGSVANSLSDAIAFSLLGDRAKHYGRQRIWGSLGWGLSSTLWGVIIDKLNAGSSGNNYNISYYVFLICFVLDMLVCAKMDVKIVQKSDNIKKDVQQLFNNIKVVTFAFWCFICGVYTSLLINFLFWYLEELAKGISGSGAWLKTMEGLVLTTECYIGEIPFLYFVGKIIKRLGNETCMTIVLCAFGIRFIGYSMITNPWYVLPLEPLNGITFGLFYTTMTTHASNIAPPGTAATIQNIFSCFFDGAGIAVGSLLGGYLVNIFGTSKTFFITGTSSFIFALLHLLFVKYTNSGYRPVWKNDAATPEDIMIKQEKEVITES